MHLLRVQVPKFRALENVDITFEKDFTPRIFPLGSLNGGGKSTLLQLIFTLLHCSSDPEKTSFITNLLNGYHCPTDENLNLFTTFDIYHDNQIFTIKFFTCSDLFLKRKIPGQKKIPSQKLETWSDIANLNQLRNQLENTRKNIESLRIITINIEQFANYYDIDVNKKEGWGDKLNSTEMVLKWNELINNFSHEINQLNLQIDIATDLTNFTRLVPTVRKVLGITIREYREKETNFIMQSDNFNIVTNYLESENLAYIADYATDSKQSCGLLCSVDSWSVKQVIDFLSDLSKKIFFMAAATQVFLFLDKNTKHLLLRNYAFDSLKTSPTYEQKLATIKLQLPNFSVNDFINTNVIVDLFKEARDKDFVYAMKFGEYGDNFQKLTAILNQFFGSKRIILEGENLSQIQFTENKNGEAVTVELEDLSHGELRRLSLFAWLKLADKQDSIILIDEIEIGLHPDWQFQIVRDLQGWAPHSQFILATHSYDVCQALTPAHVKELNPQLLKQPS